MYGKNIDISRHFEYDYSTGDLTALIDPLGNRTEYKYDRLGRVLSEKLPDGNEKTYVYDDINDRTTVVGWDGLTLIYTFDQLGKMTEVKEKHQNLIIAQINYDNYGIQTSYIDGNNTETHYTYDRHMRFSSTKKIDFNGNIQFDVELNYINSKEISGASYLKAKQNILSDNADITESYYFDRFGRTVSEEKNDDGIELKSYYSYDTKNNLTENILFNNQKESFIYNSLGKLLKATNTDGSHITMTYDMLGNMTSKTDECGETTYYQYDNAGRILKEISPFDGEKHRTTKFYYNAVGNLVKKTDPEGYSVYYEYNSRGFLTKVITPIESGSADVIKYTYDSEGRIVSFGRDDQITKYEYNGFGDLIKIVSPSDTEWTYSYDSMGNRLSSTDPNGVTSYYTYDGLNRIVSVYNDKDGEKGEISYIYDLNGLLSSVSGIDKYESITYDDMGRLKEWKNNESIVKSYTYDELSRIKNLTVSRGGEIYSDTDYSYDDAGLVSSVKDGEAEVKISYDSARREILRKNLLTGTESRTEYYPFGRVKSLTYTGLEEDLKYEYTYDLKGNILSKSENGDAASHYMYDAKSRVTEANLATGIELHYEYDAYDNISHLMRVYDNAMESTAYVYDKSNCLLDEMTESGEYGKRKSGVILKKWTRKRRK